jgi:hypothetical protein
MDDKPVSAPKSGRWEGGKTGRGLPASAVPRDFQFDSEMQLQGSGQ